MKSIIAFFMLLSAFLGILSADDVTTDSFMIQAGYENACTVKIHPIAAQSTSYIGGMPFNIEEDIVQYHADDVGRRIATIDMISNTRFTLTFEANGPMVPADITKKTAEPLDYILTFQFLLGFYEGGNINDGGSVTIPFHSNQRTMTWSMENFPDPDTFLGTVDGAIYFMFEQSATEFIMGSEDGSIPPSDDATLPPGDYISTVTITITGEE